MKFNVYKTSYIPKNGSQPVELIKCELEIVPGMPPYELTARGDIQLLMRFKNEMQCALNTDYPYIDSGIKCEYVLNTGELNEFKEEK